MRFRTLQRPAIGTPIQADIRRLRNDWQYKQIMSSYRKRHPYCQRCLASGHIAASDDTHHIQRVEDGGATEDANLLALCKRCHVGIDELSKAEQYELKRFV